MPSSASAPTEIYTLSLHDALPICRRGSGCGALLSVRGCPLPPTRDCVVRSCPDRKSTRLNSSHLGISYAVFCFGAHRDLHSFPTRRSSDLSKRVGMRCPSFGPGLSPPPHQRLRCPILSEVDAFRSDERRVGAECRFRWS